MQLSIQADRLNIQIDEVLIIRKKKLNELYSVKNMALHPKITDRRHTYHTSRCRCIGLIALLGPFLCRALTSQRVALFNTQLQLELFWVYKLYRRRFLTGKTAVSILNNRTETAIRINYL
ncbi:hypothetical protein ACS25C_10910 [Dickeya undicola]